MTYLVGDLTMPPSAYRPDRAVTTEEQRAAVKLLRRQLNYTQEELARALDVTVSTVNRWECGQGRTSRMGWRAMEHLALARGIAWSVPANLRVPAPPDSV